MISRIFVWRKIFMQKICEIIVHFCWTVNRYWYMLGISSNITNSEKFVKTHGSVHRLSYTNNFVKTKWVSMRRCDLTEKNRLLIWWDWGQLVCHCRINCMMMKTGHLIYLEAHCASTHCSSRKLLICTRAYSRTLVCHKVSATKISTF